MQTLLVLLAACTPQDATFTESSYHAWLALGSSATVDDVQKTCNDGQDNNGNGKEDADDPRCKGAVGVPVAQGVTPDGCSDGEDNDGDGLADEDDPDCTHGFGEVDFLSLTRGDGDSNVPSFEDDEDGSQFESWLESNTNGTLSNHLLDCAGNLETSAQCDGNGEYFSWLNNDAYLVSQDALAPWRSEAILTSEGDFQLTLHHDLGDGYDFRLAMVIDPDFRPSICIQEGQTCYTGEDNDGDGLVDTEDPDCLYGGWEIGFTAAACNDGFDNDGDGSVDSEDVDCLHPFYESEASITDSCSNDEDDDGDSWVDGEDPDCSTVGNHEDGATNSIYACADGLDNDGDGYQDADDPSCKNGYDNTEDGPNGKKACIDLYDNDGDGWSDADDMDCDLGNDELGYLPVGCNDGIDNDADGLIDAEDPGCLSSEDASEEDNDGGCDAEDVADNGSCCDETDNDGDGWVDREDPDCLFGTGEDDLYFGLSDCNDGEDNDSEDGTDADDRDCENGLDNNEEYYGSGSCNDAEDNDADGWTDGDDPDCDFSNSEDGHRALVCNDGQDNDGDGFVDADDPDCLSSWVGSEGPSDASCTNGTDDDGDGWVDLDDSGCLWGMAESDSLLTDCNDGLDNDGDNTTDAEDEDCTSSSDMVEAITDPCEDGVDNDGDGWVDGDDPDCLNGIVAHERGFTAGRCNDGLDNDEDGSFDGDDAGCSTASDTWESEFDECTDGLDNDSDGWVDSLDPDCGRETVYEDATLAVSECNDGVDNDGDGSVDIADPDCRSAWDNIEATELAGEPIPYDLDHSAVLDEWSQDEEGYTIYYLNAGSYQQNPADDEDFWSLPQEWLSGYAVGKYGSEEFDVLSADFFYVGTDATNPDAEGYDEFVVEKQESSAVHATELADYGLMRNGLWAEDRPMSFRIEDNTWRPVDTAMAGLDNWVEKHHSWVRISEDSQLEEGGRVTGDFQIYMAGFESASNLVVQGSFEVDSLQVDRWAYGVLEDEIRERNDTVVCEY